MQVTEQRWTDGGVLQGPSRTRWELAEVPLQQIPPNTLRDVAIPQRCGYLDGLCSPRTQPPVDSDGSSDLCSGSTVSSATVSTLARALLDTSAQLLGSAPSGATSAHQSSSTLLQALEALAPSVVESGIVTQARMTEHLLSVTSFRYSVHCMLDWCRAQLDSRMQARAAGIILRSWRFYVSESPYSDEYETMNYLLDEDIAVGAPPYRFLLRNMHHSEDSLL